MTDGPREEHQDKNGSDSFLSKLYRPGPLIILFVLAFCALAWTGYALLTDTPPPPAVVVTDALPKSEEDETPKVYEEDQSSFIEDKVKQVDLTIIEILKKHGLSMHDLKLLDVAIRQHGKQNYHFQALQLPTGASMDTFMDDALPLLQQRVSGVAASKSDAHTLSITIDGEATHALSFTEQVVEKPTPLPKGPSMAVVIDDIGENMHVLHGLVSLDIPLTLAVWPHASHTKEAIAAIKQAKRQIIVHFPMEPMGYPRYNPGDDALFTKMTAEQISKQVAINLEAVPDAIGVNNHMGSRFTSYAPGLKVALREFKQRGLFFLDSLTTGKSVGKQVSTQVGIPFYVRDIFIDNVKDVAAITHQLKKAERVALNQGHSIAIGHPYKETLAALKEWSANRNNSIQLLFLSQLPAQ